MAKDKKNEKLESKKAVQLSIEFSSMGQNAPSKPENSRVIALSTYSFDKRIVDFTHLVIKSTKSF